MSNVITDIEATLPRVDFIPDSGVSGIYDTIARELERWIGKKETDQSMLDTLADYWASVGWTSWDKNTSTPWSAAFVSYVLGPDFPGASSHRKYVQEIVAGSAPDWEAFSIPKNLDQIKLNPGDVLVKPRSGGWGNSHGAVVMEAGGGVARLAGGNVSNTAKVESEIKIDDDRHIVGDLGSFAVILKNTAAGSSAGGRSASIAPIVAGLALAAFFLIRGST
ncbi:MAG: DUF2272 domain-containing protein [bacterium]|nr:DUF2272 domain-containing protein [Hyphomicrobium sp.]MCP5023655.1 DUF2272 domain-containing protein [bacterium]